MEGYKRMATNALGNTKARAYQLTLNQPENYEEVLNYLTGLKSMDFLISAKEIAPTTGHEHIHIYAHFRTPMKLSLKKCGGAHIEKCRGSPKQNIAYIRKDGEILDEIGEEPHQGASKTVGELREIEDPSELDWHAYNTWKKIKNEKKLKISDFRKKIKVYWIMGPSGIGKTNKAIDILEENGIEEFEEVKCANGFWTGVIEGTGACLYDDFRDSHMAASEFINFIDYNVHNLNLKGSWTKNKYDLIIITSILDPRKIYRNMNYEAREQWLRRIVLINLDKSTEAEDCFEDY